MDMFKSHPQRLGSYSRKSGNCEEEAVLDLTGLLGQHDTTTESWI